MHVHLWILLSLGSVIVGLLKVPPPRQVMKEKDSQKLKMCKTVPKVGPPAVAARICP